MWCDHLTDGGVESELTYVNDVLYAATTSALLALDARTGKRLWTAPLKKPDPYSHILVTDTMVYVESYLNAGSSAGVLQALDARSGKLRWLFQAFLVDDPVLANGIIYLASESTLHALNAQTGEQRWVVPLAGVWTVLAVAYGLLYLGTSASDGTKQFQAFALKTGQGVWSQALEGDQSACDPFVADDVVYVCSQSIGSSFTDTSHYWLYALDASSGQQLRELLSGSRSFVPGELVVADGHIYLSGEDFGFGGGEMLEVWG